MARTDDNGWSRWKHNTLEESNRLFEELRDKLTCKVCGRYPNWDTTGPHDEFKHAVHDVVKGKSNA